MLSVTYCDQIEEVAFTLDQNLKLNAYCYQSVIVMKKYEAQSDNIKWVPLKKKNNSTFTLTLLTQG